MPERYPQEITIRLLSRNTQIKNKYFSELEIDLDQEVRTVLI